MAKEKINYKEEYESLKDRHDNLQDDYDDRWTGRDIFLLIILTILTTILILGIILAVSGKFDKPLDKLDIDKDTLAKEHVIKYYPEYEDCNVKYHSILWDNGYSYEGVEIYCDKLSNRDGLKVSMQEEPTEILFFDGITLEEIFTNKINGK